MNSKRSFIKALLKGEKQGAAALFLMVLVVLLASCSTTKEMRRANRASKKLDKLTMRYPELLQPDTLRDTVAAVVTTIRVDTAYAKADTIYLEKDRLRVRVITEHDTIRLTGEYLGDTIYVPVEIPIEKIQPKEYKPIPLKWWQQALIPLGVIFFLRVFPIGGYTIFFSSMPL